MLFQSEGEQIETGVSFGTPQLQKKPETPHVSGQLPVFLAQTCSNLWNVLPLLDTRVSLLCVVPIHDSDHEQLRIRELQSVRHFWGEVSVPDPQLDIARDDISFLSGP